jgi:hypothetical protein
MVQAHLSAGASFLNEPILRLYRTNLGAVT